MNKDLKELLILSELVSKLSKQAMQMFDINPDHLILDISLQLSDSEKVIISELKNLGSIMDRLNNTIGKLAPKIQSGDYVLVPKMPTPEMTEKGMVVLLSSGESLECDDLINAHRRMVELSQQEQSNSMAEWIARFDQKSDRNDEET